MGVPFLEDMHTLGGQDVAIILLWALVEQIQA